MENVIVTRLQPLTTDRIREELDRKYAPVIAENKRLAEEKKRLAEEIARLETELQEMQVQLDTGAT